MCRKVGNPLRKVVNPNAKALLEPEVAKNDDDGGDDDDDDGKDDGADDG